VSSRRPFKLFRGHSLLTPTWLALAAALLLHSAHAMSVGDPKAPSPARPQARIAISKETTYITEPLRPDGYPDYIAALNRLASKDVTPENNAAVLLVQAFGPKLRGMYGEPVSDKERGAFFRMLGIAPPPDNSNNYYVGLLAYAKTRPKNAEEREAKKEAAASESLIYSQQERAGESPWSKTECPLVAAWLDRNEKPLALVAEASRKTRFFAPLIPRPWRRGPGPWMGGVGFENPLVGPLRQATRALETRAMLRLFNGDVEGAWTDLQACHRLCRLLSQGPISWNYATAIPTERGVYHGDWQLAHFGHLTPKQAEKYRAAIANLPPLPNDTESLPLSDRLEYLMGVCAMARGDATPAEIFPYPRKSVESSLTSWVRNDTLDWNQVLRLGNRHFDAIVQAHRGLEWSQRMAAIVAIQEHLDREMVKLKQGADTEAVHSARDPESSNHPQLLPQNVSVASLASFSYGNMSILVLIESRQAIIDMRLTQIALALGAYRTENGRYPKRLDAIVPKYLATLPGDPYDGDKPFRFRGEHDGYLLYSVGRNGVDDTGPQPAKWTWSSADGPPPSWQNSDDIGIRIGTE
jgi:hypothetical protein